MPTTCCFWLLHQMVCDGWSMRLFCRELGIFYRSYVAAEAAALAELPIQYRDYALRQRERFHSELLEQQLAYWRERLRDSLPGIGSADRSSASGAADFSRRTACR